MRKRISVKHRSLNRKIRWQPFAVVGLCLGLVFGATAKVDDGHAQRVLFLESKKALERGDYETFGRNIQQLQEYPLYPYLIYW